MSDGLLTRISKRPDRGQGDWHATFDDGTVIRAVTAECDPYEKQAAAFLDAVEGPTRAASSRPTRMRCGPIA